MSLPPLLPPPPPLPLLLLLLLVLLPSSLDPRLDDPPSPSFFKFCFSGCLLPLPLIPPHHRGSFCRRFGLLPSSPQLDLPAAAAAAADAPSRPLIVEVVLLPGCLSVCPSVRPPVVATALLAASEPAEEPVPRTAPTNRTFRSVWPLPLPPPARSSVAVVPCVVADPSVGPPPISKSLSLSVPYCRCLCRRRLGAGRP